jgi:peroxiredoxin
MMRQGSLLLVTVGFVVGVVSLGFAGPGPGDPAPDFTLPDTALVDHSLSDFTGKVVVLNLWDVT